MPRFDFFARHGLFVARRFFDADVCSQLRRETRTAPGIDASVISHGIPVVNKDTRRTTACEVSRSSISMVQDHLEAIKPTLEEHFGFVLQGCDTPVFLLYKTGDYFRPHRDRSCAADAPEAVKNRQVSVTIILSPNIHESDGDCYRGGTLTFYRLTPNVTWTTCRTPLIEEEGLLIAFPSTLFHEVTPLKRERVSIVSWFH